MSNTREKPIPADAPGRLIAEYLRRLRRLAGGPAYRKLAPLAHLTQNALSQQASGKYVIQWESMRRYVEAVVVYAQHRHIDLHAAMRAHAEEFAVDPDDELLTQARTVYERNVAEQARKGLPTPPPLGVPGAQQPEPDDAEPDEGIDEPQPVPGPNPPETLVDAATLQDLVGVMNDQILQLGWDLSARTWDVHRVGVPPYLLEREALDTLTGRVRLTDRVFALILHACGAGVFDEQTFHPHHKEWTLAWQRATSDVRERDDPPAGDGDGDAGIAMTEAVDPDRAANFWVRLVSWPRWRLTRQQWRRHVTGTAAQPGQAPPSLPNQRTADHDSSRPSDRTGSE